MDVQLNQIIRITIYNKMNFTLYFNVILQLSLFNYYSNFKGKATPSSYFLFTLFLKNNNTAKLSFYYTLYKFLFYTNYNNQKRLINFFLITLKLLIFLTALYKSTNYQLHQLFFTLHIY